MAIENIIIISCAGLIVWSFVWSHKVKQRRRRAKFKQKLQGYKFGSLKELKVHWHGRIHIDITGGDFDEFRFGNLLETLKMIDEAATKEWIRWNS